MLRAYDSRRDDRYRDDRYAVCKLGAMYISDAPRNRRREPDRYTRRSSRSPDRFSSDRDHCREYYRRDDRDYHRRYDRRDGRRDDRRDRRDSWEGRRDDRRSGDRDRKVDASRDSQRADFRNEERARIMDNRGDQKEERNLGPMNPERARMIQGHEGGARREDTTNDRRFEHPDRRARMEQEGRDRRAGGRIDHHEVRSAIA